MSAHSSTLRVAVVGAGPAGFYATEQLLKAPDMDVEVELFDRLPTPWGLVRGGVAPDNQKMKSVSKVFEKTASLAGFRFHGNVEIGTHLTHDDLLEHHHAVIYSYGASADRRLGIPGEELPGSWPATDFVAWYNGHPDACDLEFDLSARRAVIVGNGNVALDCARLLARTPQELARTDAADHAIEVLSASNIEEIVLLGRRGPAQAAFTAPELRMLHELADCDIVVDPQDLELDAASREWLESGAAAAPTRRNVETVRQFGERPSTGAGRRIVLRFLASPVEILGDRYVEGVRIGRNELVADEHGGLRARPTGEVETLECGLVLRSIGYRGVATPGLPFDERAGIVPNEGGRALDPATGEPLPGVYVSGWIKRGPSGVIGTNKKDAHETVAHLLEDHAGGRLPQPVGGADGLDALLAERQPDRVDYVGWQRIDTHERERGAESDRPRVKLTRMDELVERGVEALSGARR